MSLEDKYYITTYFDAAEFERNERLISRNDQLKDQFKKKFGCNLYHRFDKKTEQLHFFFKPSQIDRHAKGVVEEMICWIEGWAAGVRRWTKHWEA